MAAPLLRAARVAIATCLGLAVPASGQSALRSFSGEQAGDTFGISSAAGDVDGDGVADLIVGAYQSAGNGQGYVQVLSGATSQTWLRVNGDLPGDRLGRAVAFVGDLDGDGHGELLAGAYQPFVDGPGYARLYSGQDGQVLREYRGDQTGDNLGGAVAAGFDLDGDGRPDLVLGAPQRQQPGGGYVRAFSGAGEHLLRQWTGPEPGDTFGSTLAFLGDTDGDGVPDLLIGAPQIDRAAAPGRVYLYSGATGSLRHTFSGSGPGDDFGIGLARLDDIDGDGIDDVLVGAPGGRGAAHRSGYACVYSGASGQLLHRIVSSIDSEFLGFSAAGLGDVNGDGIPDLALGAYGTAAFGPQSGSVSLFSGASGNLLRKWYGAQADDHLGISLARLPDQDGDGVPDLAAGAFRSDRSGLNSGSLLLLGTRQVLSTGEFRVAEAGGMLDLWLREVEPDTEVLLAVVNADGTEVFRPLVRDHADAGGNFHYRLLLPIGLRGWVVVFRFFWLEQASGTLQYDEQTYVIR